MKVILVDLPLEQQSYILKNCKHLKKMDAICVLERESLNFAQTKELLVISENPKILSEAIATDAATIAYQNPNAHLWTTFPNVDMIVEGFEEVDERFLERVYQRHHNIPWTILTTERLTVRELELSDLDALFEMYSYEGMTEYMEGLYPYEEEYAYQKAYVESMYRFFGYGMWLVFEKETGKLVGRAGIEHREELGGELELGYAIAKPYWGRGYATEVCQAIINYAKEELGFPSICSLIEPENAVSIHLAEKLGFQFEKEVKLTCKKYKKYVQKL